MYVGGGGGCDCLALLWFCWVLKNPPKYILNSLISFNLVALFFTLSRDVSIKCRRK